VICLPKTTPSLRERDKTQEALAEGETEKKSEALQEREEEKIGNTIRGRAGPGRCIHIMML